MKLNRGILGCLFLVTLFFSACQDKEASVTPKKDNLTKGDVFDFSTTQNIEIDIQYNVPKDFQVHFEAYTKNPVELDEIGDYVKISSVRPFLEGYTDKNGACKMTLELPGATEEIYVYSETIGVPALLYGKVENGKVVITDESEAVKSKTLVTRASVYWKNWKKQKVEYTTLPNGNWSPNGRPHNLLSPGLELDAEALGIINATIPKGEKLDPRFCTFNEIALSELSRVKLYYVSNNHPRNAIAYYTFTGNQPSQEWINKNLTLIYPRLHRGALKPGDGVELKYRENGEWKDQFPAGTKIGFVLLVDAWHAQEVTTQTNVMYSYKGYNSYDIIGSSIMADRPQMAVFKAGDRFVLSFEDYPWTQAPGSPYQGDFSDNVFILEADPETALPPVEDGKEPGEPDGVLRAFNQGMVAFEDLWPYKGDYDMNDIVLKYRSGIYLREYTNVTAVRDTFVLMNNGAGNVLGFGYELSTDASNIKRVKVISDYTCEGQGWDEGAEKATIMLFDNVHNVRVGTSFIVEIDFKESVLFPNFKTAPYNPFTVVCSKEENGNYPDYMANNRREVHLVNNAPTYKMNELLFHTGDDLSNPKNGVYYVSDAKYPFALNIPYEYWKVPAEKQNISDVYPKFDSWVSSNGTKDKDWWEKPAN